MAKICYCYEWLQKSQWMWHFQSLFCTLDSVVLVCFSFIIIVQAVNRFSLDVVSLVTLSIYYGPGLLHLLLRYLTRTNTTLDQITAENILFWSWSIRNSQLCIRRCGWSGSCRWSADRAKPSASCRYAWRWTASPEHHCNKHQHSHFMTNDQDFNLYCISSSRFKH